MNFSRPFSCRLKKLAGFIDIEIDVPTRFSEPDIQERIRKKTGLKHFIYEILLQSLDARKKPDIRWHLRVRVISEELKSNTYVPQPPLSIPYRKRNQHVVIVGSGPAGFFAGYVLRKGGFDVTILEKGPPVKERWNHILEFESGGRFRDYSNYCHGEGGAGTFSDGKLTSRTKDISREKKFVFDLFIKAGAPGEIAYLSKPHIGSDKLRKIIPALRKMFEDDGGKIYFRQEVINLEFSSNKCVAVITENNEYVCDWLILAPGHSSYKTYRMLMDKGVAFRCKPFAIGVRVEHPQSLINISQWGVPSLPGLKSAEYKLTYTASNGLPVYSFCMCPGGKVVPSAPAQGQNIVNGVSNYARNSGFANSAIVVGTDLTHWFGSGFSPEDALKWVEKLEQKVFHHTSNYQAPAQLIKDFLKKKTSDNFPENSYPLGVYPYSFDDLFLLPVTEALREGLKFFSTKIRGFETGIMIGLESKTSSPVQVLRNEMRQCLGFENIFMIGEGSGYAGGITSSAVDGIKLAMDLCKQPS